MVDIADIPDFPNQPGQRPTPGAPTPVVPIPVVLVNAPLDAAGEATPINAAAVDAYIAAEVAANRAFSTTVERWSPWSELDMPLGFAAASQYNYARMTIDGMNFYGYLTAVYQNLTTTTYQVTPDDCATYPYTLGYSTVLRGHVAVAASQSDPYGDQYLTTPEPIDAPPTRSVLDGSILNSSTSAWKVLVVSTNDLRGSGDTPYFERHVFADQISSAADFASDATAARGGGVQVQVPEASYPWADRSGAAAFRWPFDLSTFNMNNGRPEDNFRTAARPTHRGMDMGYGVANVLGTPIPIIAGGTVTGIANDPVYGHRVEISHPGGRYRSTYSHMNTATDLPYLGDVSAGAIAGPIGSTGAATGNHLHLEIYDTLVGDYIDPLIFMAEFNPDNLVAGSSLPAGTIAYTPLVTPSPVSRIDGITVGGGAYIFTLEGYAAYMTIMQGAPWVLGGIVSTRIVPAWSVPAGGGVAFTAQTPPTEPLDSRWSDVAGIPSFQPNITTGSTTATALAGWRDTVAASLGIGVYRKLLTSQFTRITVSDGESSHEFLPEVWKASGVSFNAVTEATHGTPTIRAIPTGYTALGEQQGIPFAFGGTEGVALNGRAMAASNTAQQDMSPWMSAYSSFTTRLALLDQQALALDLAYEQARLSVGVQGIQSSLGVVSGAMGGGAAGALSGAVGGLGALGTTAITASANLDILDMKNDGSFDIATYQMGVSGMASYYAYNAWVQSMKSVSGQGTPSAIAGAWRIMANRALDVMILAPTADAIRRAITMWERYGYMIDRAFTPPRLDAMSNYTYWQIDRPTILGPMPSDARDRIAARFAAGTTVWNNVAEIGTQPTNTPVPGVTY